MQGAIALPKRMSLYYRPETRIPLLVAIFLWCIITSFGAESYISTEIPLPDLAKDIGASFEYNPLTKSGVLEKNGRTVRFSEGFPYVLLDWTLLKELPPPIETEMTIAVKPEFAEAIRKFFSEKRSGSSRYTIKAIVIDPGHGGKDPGAIGEFDGMRLQEKDLNLEVGLRLAQLLQLRYPERNILMTRSDDSYPSLEERVELANSIKLAETEAVIFISIHANASFNKNTNGYEVWYLNPNFRRTLVDEKTAKEKGEDLAPIINTMLEEEFTTESIILAQKVYRRLGQTIGEFSPPRGIRAEEWFVVRNAKMPSILIEMGFVTNKIEMQLLSQPAYLRKIADAVYNGVCDFIEHFEQ